MSGLADRVPGQRADIGGRFVQHDGRLERRSRFLRLDVKSFTTLSLVPIVTTANESAVVIVSFTNRTPAAVGLRTASGSPAGTRSERHVGHDQHHHYKNNPSNAHESRVGYRPRIFGFDTGQCSEGGDNQCDD